MDISLIISIDQSNKSDEIETIAQKATWKHGEKKIIRYSERLGLKKHILNCGDLSQKYGAVIILEDDLFVSPEFYNYTCAALNKYEQAENVAGIALYSHWWNGYGNCSFRPAQSGFDSFFGQFSITWGQCWTASQWKKFKLWYMNQGETFTETYNLPQNVMSWGKQSWGKYFIKYIVENNLYYVIPYNAMSTNFSDTGEHCNAVNTAHQVPLAGLAKRNYVFPNAEEGYYYDVFFDRIFSKSDSIKGIAGNQICVDLNYSKRRTDGKRYLLTNRRINKNPIDSFGIKLRPVEENAVYSIPGKEIFLYDIQGEIIEFKNETLSTERLAYEVYGLYVVSLFKYSLKTLLSKLAKKVKRVVKRK